MSNIQQAAGRTLLYLNLPTVGNDILLGYAQAVNIQSTRQKIPVRVIGSVSPIAVQRGSRVITGQLVNAITAKSLFSEIMSALASVEQNSTVQKVRSNAVFEFIPYVYYTTTGKKSSDITTLVTQLYKQITNNSDLTAVKPVYNNSSGQETEYSINTTSSILNNLITGGLNGVMESDIKVSRAPIYLDELEGINMKIHVPLEIVNQTATVQVNKGEGTEIETKTVEVLFFQTYYVLNLHFLTSGIQIQSDNIAVFETIDFQQERAVQTLNYNVILDSGETLVDLELG